MNPAHLCATLDRVFEGRKLKWNEVTFETDLEVELYPRLYLDGHITCLLQLDQYNGDIIAIADQRLKVRNKHDDYVVVDWDDLKERTQDKINSKVRHAYKDTDRS